MKKFEIPLITIIELDEVDVIATSEPTARMLMKEGYFEADIDDSRHGNSRGPWDNDNPWD